MLTRTATLVGALLWGAAAQAQPSPPAGVLQAPPSASATRPAPPPAPPKAAPRMQVQQMAPMASPPLPAPPARPPPARSALGTPAPGGAAPVVAPRANAQPLKPAGRPAAGTAAKVAAGAAAGAAAAAAAAAKPPPAAPAATAAPTAPAAEPPAAPAKGSATGQPLPRWAGILYDGVRLRVGPGQRYPIDWIYRRPDQPVRVLREFDTWRLIEDHEGVKGWVHQSNLTGRRSFMVGTPQQTLRRSPADDAAPVAILRQGVVGRIRSCPAASAWCEVRTGDHRGWIRRDGLWGLSPDEAIGN